MTSYQKVKSQNAELRKQIAILIDSPNSTQALEIKMAHNFYKKIETAIWFGNPKNLNTGILTQIIK